MPESTVTLQDSTRKRLQQKRALFSLRELAERIGVSNVVLHHFLHRKSLRPVNLRKVLAWLDGGVPPVVEEMDRLLAELLPDVVPKEREGIRRDVWQAIRRGVRRAALPIPDWLDRQATQPPAKRRPHRKRAKSSPSA